MGLRLLPRDRPDDAGTTGWTLLRPFDAIYLGAIGAPSVPDHVSVWELILPIRQRFGQYVNLRPVRLLPGIGSPLAGRGAADIDMLCVRENSEGEYAGVGGRVHAGTPDEVAEQTGDLHAPRHRAHRPIRVRDGAVSGRASCSRARPSPTRCSTRWCCGTRSSGGVAPSFRTSTVRKYHVDALAARMITHPQSLDVIVASNLFGDILTDIGSAISGSMGVAPGANINPERTAPSMFEPIHGSAPDIAGKGIANPIGAIWAGALMLDHLGERQAHDAIIAAIAAALGNGIRTRICGGTATTVEMMRGGDYTDTVGTITRKASPDYTVQFIHGLHGLHGSIHPPITRITRINSSADYADVTDS